MRYSKKLMRAKRLIRFIDRRLNDLERRIMRGRQEVRVA